MLRPECAMLVYFEGELDERLKISGLINILFWPRQSFWLKQPLSAKKDVLAESPKEKKAEKPKPNIFWPKIWPETEPTQYSVDH